MPPQALVAVLQWCRRSSSAETVVDEPNDVVVVKLQWCRRSSSAETLTREQAYQIVDACFNGAADRRRRRPSKVSLSWSCSSRLQWCRRSSSAETTRTRAGALPRRRGFNGAADRRRRRLFRLATGRRARHVASMVPPIVVGGDSARCSRRDLSRMLLRMRAVRGSRARWRSEAGPAVVHAPNQQRDRDVVPRERPPAPRTCPTARAATSSSVELFGCQRPRRTRCLDRTGSRRCAPDSCTSARSATCSTTRDLDGPGQRRGSGRSCGRSASERWPHIVRARGRSACPARAAPRVAGLCSPAFTGEVREAERTLAVRRPCAVRSDVAGRSEQRDVSPRS